MNPWYTQLLLSISPVAACAISAWSLRMLLVTALKRAADRGYEEGWEDRSRSASAATEIPAAAVPIETRPPVLECGICGGSDHGASDHPHNEYMTWTETRNNRLAGRHAPSSTTQHAANARAYANGQADPYPDAPGLADPSRGTAPI